MVHLEDPADELNDEVQCMKEVKVHVLVMHEQSPFDNRKKDMCQLRAGLHRVQLGDD